MKKLISTGFFQLCFIALCSAQQTIPTTVNDSLTLDEIVVTAQRRIYKLKGNTLTTSVRNTPLSTSGTANDVLKHIPGIRKTEDGFTVFGKETPLIYINNRLIQDSSELSKLNSEEIEKVELNNNPGAAYAATVKAVIHIKTIRRKNKGISVDAMGRIAQGKCTSHSEQLNLNYQKEKFSLFSTLYYFQQAIKRNQDVMYDIRSRSNCLVNSHSSLPYKAKIASGKLGFGYDLSPKQTFGMAYEVNGIPRACLDATSNYSATVNGVLTDQIDYTSQSIQNGITHQVNAYYQGQVNQLKIDFTADFIRRKNDNDQEAYETSQVTPPREIISSSRSKNTFYAAKLLFSHSLGKGELKAGVEYTNIRREDSFINPQELLPTTDSRINEEKIAGFAEYAITWKKVSSALGLRWEHTASDYLEKGIRIPEQSRTYNDWCPNLSLNLPIGALQTSLSYNIKTNRPSFSQLRSNLNYNNRFVYEGGNPLLKPQTNHDISLMALYRWMQFSVGYQYRKDVIAFAAKSYEGSPDVVIFSMDNFKKMQLLTSSVNLSPRFRWWKPELGLYFTKPFFQVANEGKERKMNRPHAYFAWNNSFELPAGIILSVDMDYQTAGDAGAMHQRSNGGVDAGIRKSFLNKSLSVNIQASDLFASRRNSMLLYGSTMTYNKKSYADSRQLSLTLRYRFNAGQPGYKGKHASDKDMQRL
ncbi:MAG: outer membrane beta-barrel family protein [Bacteroides sp.]